MVITALGHVAGSKYNGEGFINGIFVVVVAAFVSAIFLTIASSMPRLAPQEVAWLEKMLPQDMWNYIYIYLYKLLEIDILVSWQDAMLPSSHLQLATFVHTPMAQFGQHLRLFNFGGLNFGKFMSRGSCIQQLALCN